MEKLIQKTKGIMFDGVTKNQDFQQFLLLFWKNLQVYKKNKARLFFDLTWPLFLISMLVAVRRGYNTDLVSIEHECHFGNKALLSAGVFNFVQKYICNFNNTCHENPIESSNFYTEVDSQFVTALNDIEKEIKPNQSYYSGLSQHLIALMQHLSRFEPPNYDSMNQTLFPMLQELLKNVQNLNGTLSKESNNHGKRSVRPIFRTVLHEMKDLYEAYSKLSKLPNVIKFMENVSYSMNLIKQIKPNDTRLPEDYLKRLLAFSRLICSSKFEVFTITHVKQSQFVEKLESAFFKTSLDIHLVNESSDPNCNRLLSILESIPGLNVMWKIIKPIVMGKILYSPRNPVTDRIMANVRINFDRMNNFHKFIKDFAHFLAHSFAKGIDTKYHRLLAGKLINLTEYSVNAESYAQTMAQISNTIACFDFDKVVGFDSEARLVRESYRLMDTNRLYAAVVFLDMENVTMHNSSKIPPFIRYKIRMNSDKVDPTNTMYNMIDHEGPRRNPLTDLKYYHHGFLFLQDIIDTAIIDALTDNQYPESVLALAPENRNKSEIRKHYIRKPGIFMQQTPHPCYRIDSFLKSITRLLPLIFCICWNYNVAMLIKSMVYEKEARLKEYLRIMGMKFNVYRLSWYLSNLMTMSISGILMVILLTYGEIFLFSDKMALLVLVTANNLASISFAFLMSSLFSRAIMGASVGGLCYFLSYLPFSYYFRFESILPLAAKLSFCLVSNISVSAAILHVARLEMTHTGLQWYNMHVDSHEDRSKFGVGLCILMLLVDACLYYVVAVYIETIAPGNYGIPQPWYYPASPVLKFLSKPAKMLWNYGKLNKNGLLDQGTDQQRTAHFEAEPINSRKGIEIRNLTKVYGKRTALNNLNVNFYENHISVLLGHNGAGKSTAISMIVGVIQPDAGKIRLCGHDIEDNVLIIKELIGLCPQYNVLIDDFTVEEHLWFYAKLKNFGRSVTEQEIMLMLETIDMFDHRFQLAKNLSGGLKRRLCIAIAFVGNSRVVILDEPTAGVDPYSRHGIWDILIKFKKGRTILLTTHYMDEANLLGDRITILSQGKIRCCGSALFLKSIFAKGYNLTVEKGGNINLEMLEKKVDILETYFKERSDAPVTKPKDEDGVFIEIFLRILRHFIPKSEIIEKLGDESTFLLPYTMKANAIDSSMNYDALKNLFFLLEDNSENLGIKNYGLTDASLEEVFIRVTTLHDLTNTEQRVEEILNETTDQGKYALATKKGTTLHTRNNSLGQKIFTLSQLKDRISEFEVSQATGTDGEKKGSNIDFSGAGLVSVYEMRRSLQQFVAICGKRTRRHVRNVKGFLAEVILPVSVVCLTLIFTKLIPIPPKTAPLPLSPWVFRRQQYVFFRDSTPIKSLKRKAPYDSDRFERIVDVLQRQNTTQYLTPGSDKCIYLVDDKIQTSPDPKNSSSPNDKKTYKDGYNSLLPNQAGSNFVYRKMLDNVVDRLCSPDALYMKGPRFYTSQHLSLHSPIIRSGSYNWTEPYDFGAEGADFPYQDVSYQRVNLTSQDLNPISWEQLLLSQSESLMNFGHSDRMCGCIKSGPYKCPQGAAGHLPPLIPTPGPYSLLNYTGIPDFESYLIKTTYPFDLTRVGGLEKIHYSSIINPVVHSADQESPFTLNLITDLIYTIMAELPPKLRARYGAMLKYAAPFLEKQPREFVKVWFDNRVMPSAPAFLSLYNNAYLRAVMAQKAKLMSAAPSHQQIVDRMNSMVKGKGEVKIKKDRPSSPKRSTQRRVEKKREARDGKTLRHKVDEYGIMTISHPLKSRYQLIVDMSLTLAIYMTVAIAILSALSFVPASYAAYLTEEKVNHSKHLQMTAGMSPLVYWLANFTCDFISYTITTALVIALFFIFNERFFISFGTFPAFLLMLLLYGWAIIPFMYPLIWLFEKPGSAFVIMASVNLLIGAVCTIITFLLEMIDVAEVYSLNTLLKNVFLIFPQYGLGRGLLNMVINNIMKDMATKFGGTPMSYGGLEWEYLGKNICSFLVIGWFFFTLTIMLEYGVFKTYLMGPIKRWRQHRFLARYHEKQDGRQEGSIKYSVSEEDDVTKERVKVQDYDAQKCPLVVKDLTKVYSNNVLAVDSICFLAEKGACFGLLGVNGAGKTTTFKMVTAEIAVTQGDVFVMGESVTRNRELIRQNMGYCSQEDSLDQLMTTSEILKFYALVKGIARSQIPSVIDWSIESLDLVGYENKLIRNISDGTKRKLSTAIALLGNPPIILLDEPTTGMDPKARRFLWNCILALIANQKCILFTSHTMEECEVLCSKIAIMVNGTIKCIGSPQQLKSRYGEGYFVTIKLSVEALSSYCVTSYSDALIQHITTEFPSCQIKEKHESQILVHFPIKNLKLSRIFEMLESVREKYHIQDYSITQSTLEQVFCLFAAAQKDSLQGKNKGLKSLRREYQIPYHVDASTRL